MAPWPLGVTRITTLCPALRYTDHRAQALFHHSDTHLVTAQPIIASWGAKVNGDAAQDAGRQWVALSKRRASDSVCRPGVCHSAYRTQSVKLIKDPADPPPECIARHPTGPGMITYRLYDGRGERLRLPTRIHAKSGGPLAEWVQRNLSSDATPSTRYGDTHTRNPKKSYL